MSDFTSWVGDLLAAIRSDERTIKRYRQIRKDRKILEALVYE